MRTPLLITSTALAVLLVAGCNQIQPTTTPSTPDSAASPAVVPVGASASAPATAPVIPSAAMLQPEDLRGDVPEPASDDDWAHLTPPDPCGTGLDSDPLRLAADTQQAMIPSRGAVERPTVIVEHVARYKPGGADRLLAGIRAAVGKCPGPTGDGKQRWRLTEAADGTLLLTVRSEGDLAGMTVTHSTAVGVARVGDAIVVVADAGWENRSGDMKLVQELLPPAVQRAKTMG
jgi:hypothetical protein